MNLQLIPYNEQAEQSVLGALMIDATGKVANNVFAKLKAESFYIAAHQRIFAEMQALAKLNRPIDLLTVESRLSSMGIINDVGGLAYLAEIAKNTPSVANASSYADVVRDNAIKRFALAKIQDCTTALLERSALSTEDRLDVISKMMSQIADYGRAGKQNGLRRATDIANEWLDEWEMRKMQPERVAGLSTGVEELDRLLGAKKLVKQSLVVIGARPKVGKTALFSTIAVNCVLNERKTALLFSLEMSAKLIFERMFMQRGNVKASAFYEDENQLLNMGINVDAEINKGTIAIGELIQDDLLFIDDTPAVSVAHIRNECRRIKRERGEIGLIAVDYLTLMKTEEAERNDLAYGNITKELKNLAREMDCVVLLLTQLNRQLESRGDKRPLPSDSRDTGQIEQECDYWLGLYREYVYNDKADPTLTEIHLRLNRHGSTGKIYVDQRDGAIFNCDQIDAKRRAETGKLEPKKTRQSKDF
ncbi:replicative DNA helicase [Mannheimia massilioguelmaensis]|uniref:replicative DNA helicase n=1 Tax=Mannheimia massilioguelmaensis TaxID=1604354 RepID=UPI0005CAAE60|nr:DnaB-like helicase C-terminal domain-containing protein [Mannheimia massilioguelmaensis]